MHPVAGQAGQAEHHEHHHQRHAQSHAGQAVQRDGNRHHAEGQHGVARAVKAVHGHGRAAREPAPGGPQPDQAHGHIDPEDPVPAGVLHHPAAQGRPQQRPDLARYGDEAHGANELATRIGAQHGQPPHGQHHGAAHALHHACRDQKRQAGRERAQHRAQHKQADRPAVDTSRAKAVGHPARGRNQHGRGQRIGHDDGLHLHRALAQLGRHGRQRRVENGRVQRLHEKAYGHQPQQSFFVGGTMVHDGHLTHGQLRNKAARQ